MTARRRRVFISYQHRDQMQAKGFNLMRYNKYLDLDFVGRHLLDPVHSEDRGYVTRKIKEQLAGTSVTVVLIGRGTAASNWVADEVAWSLEKGNGLVGIRLDPDADIPPALADAGAEILVWDRPEDVAAFGGAIERAATASRVGKNMPTNSIGTCARA
jgi:hypothetical protein